MTREQELENEVTKLRAAIVHHRAQKADDRCWLDDQELYAVLGDGNLGDNRVGDQAAMLENCKRFIAVRCAGGHWSTYQQLEKLLTRTAHLLATCAIYIGEQWSSDPRNAPWFSVEGRALLATSPEENHVKEARTAEGKEVSA